MTHGEAIEQVAYLKGLFPMTTETRMTFWLEQFVDKPRDPVHRAIRRYAEHHGDFVDPAGLGTLIAEEVRRETPPRNPQAEEAGVAAEWKKVDAAVASLSAETFDRLAAEALAKMPDRIRQSVQKRGKDSLALKASIYTMLVGK